MAKRLPTLCSQMYDGTTMQVETCTRCCNWRGRCTVEMGVEHLPLEQPAPDCPIQERCQHSIQENGMCPVRARGLVCVSALVLGGMDYEDAMDHPTSFHADFYG